MTGINIGGRAIVPGCIPAERNLVWMLRQVTSGTDRWHAVAGCEDTGLADYLDSTRVNVNAFVTSTPLRSWDGALFVYAKNQTTTGPAVPADLMLAALDDSLTPTAIATGTNTAGVSLMYPVGWSPDDSQVYYLRQDVTGGTGTRKLQFRRVDADGTNDTLILNTGIVDFAMGLVPRISHDGTQIAYVIDTDDAANKGIWVMNSDGTGNTKIYTSASAFSAPLGIVAGWSRDDDWLVFNEQSGSPAVRSNSIIHPDGTGKTTIFSDTVAAGNLFTMAVVPAQHSPFTPDGTQVAVRSSDFLNTNPPTPGLLATDGSETFTPLASFGTYGPLYNPVGSGWGGGPILNADGTRAVWVEGTGLDDLKVFSSLLDGSDLQVLDDMTDSSTFPQHDDFLFNGFFERNA